MNRLSRYLPILVIGLVMIGMAVRATLAAIAAGEHTPNLIAAAAAACAAAFIIGSAAARRS